MKETREIKGFQPLYFSKFTCTCDKCVYNCCHHGWQIRIDKNTYDKYVNLNNEYGKSILDTINVVSQDPFIAIIATRKEGCCAFLEDGFCSIQLKLGYDYLSRTCRIHPRSINYIDGAFETFLELSCEEAVKVVLLNEEPITLEEAVIEPDGAGNVIPNRMLNTEKYTSATNAVDIFSKLRMTTIAILQSRKYKLRFRMLLLCLLSEQTSQLLAEGKDNEVGFHADESLKLIGTGVYDNLANELPDGIDIDFNIVLDILKDMGSKKDERFNGILAQSLEGLGISAVDFQLSDSFSDDYKSYYQEFFSDKEFIFENFLINHILLEGFPFNYNKEAKVIANYADLLAKYNLIEFLLVGVCKYHNAFDEWSIIDCVSAFSRLYDHTEKGYLMMI